MGSMLFPSSPIDGQVYEKWQYNAATGQWEIIPVQVSPAPAVWTELPNDDIKRNSKVGIGKTPNASLDVQTESNSVGMRLGLDVASDRDLIVSSYAVETTNAAGWDFNASEASHGTISFSTAGSKRLTIDPTGDATFSGTLDAGDMRITSTKIRRTDDNGSGLYFLGAMIRPVDKDGTETSGELSLGTNANKFKDAYFSGTVNSSKEVINNTNPTTEWQSAGVKRAITYFDNDNNRYRISVYDAAGGDAQSSALFNHNGGVDLRYNGSQKFVTQSGGVKVTGKVTATGDVVAFSDIAFKEEINPITEALDKVSQLGGYTFKRKEDDSRKYTGVIAQEVKKVLPEAVHGEKDGELSVAYGNLVGLLIEAVKEQQIQINDLKERLEK